MNHMFDVSVAEMVGVNAAILFQNIAFWCEHSAANGTNYHDGNYWTYSSNKAFQAIFTYMTGRQIDTALKKLLEAGLIIRGNYNKSAYDRTMWYAITENGKSIYTKCKMENHKKGNGKRENVAPIPDISTDETIDININSNTDTAPDGFDDFWSVYPHKVKKQDAQKAWRSAKLGKIADVIIADVMLRCETEWKGQDIHYIPHPTTYLHQRRWEDDTKPTVRRGSEEPAPKVYKDADYENDW